MRAVIDCRTLGPIEVTVAGAVAPPELLWRKNLALMVYLARSPRRARTRQHLIGLLWADKPETAARHSLSEALRVVRRVAGEDALTTEGSTIRLAADAVRLDCDALETYAADQAWGDAAALVAGEFLEGFGVPDATDFETWLGQERDLWRRRGGEVLVAWSRALLDRGALAEATAAAERALALGPTADIAIRAAMSCRALAGDRAGALQHYDQFVTRLRTEVGAAPDVETERLAERVRRERVWRVSGGRPAGEGAAASRRAPLVEREALLARLLTEWEAGRREPKAVALVLSGFPGAGKTRLSEELQARTRLEGAAVAATRAVEADREEPWSGVWSLARGGLLDAQGLAAAAPDALAAFAARLPEWGDRFPAARGGAPLPLPRAFAEVLRAVVEEQPLLLCADDAQWLDHETHLALENALRDLARAPLAVVLAASSHPPCAELDGVRARLGRDLAGVAVVVDPLGHAGVRALARWAMPRYSDTEIERLTRRVLTDSAGLPQLVVELLHAVALGLDLSQSREAWPAPLRTLDETLPGGLPDAVVAAIRMGFRRLSADAQRVAVTTAVLGGRVDPAVLGRGTGMADEALGAALDELEWERWLTAEPRGYGFVARIVREVVARDMVTAGQRQRLLAAVGARATTAPN